MPLDYSAVRAYAELLDNTINERQLELLGELMCQSHASYSACGLGSAGTDRLVALVREAGPQHGLYGAKITGGGSGGTVAILGRGCFRCRGCGCTVCQRDGPSALYFFRLFTRGGDVWIFEIESGSWLNNSEKGKNGRPSFEQEPVYFGETTW
jgi:hypothetical protein